MAVQATSQPSPPLRDSVVKGRRNGGSSNTARESPTPAARCERPPKWRFKQLVLDGLLDPASCERPPKWRFKQHELTGKDVIVVVKGRRNGGSSNFMADGSEETTPL